MNSLRRYLDAVTWDIFNRPLPICPVCQQDIWDDEKQIELLFADGTSLTYHEQCPHP